MYDTIAHKLVTTFTFSSMCEALLSMLVSGYAAQDCLIQSNHYKKSGESETELDITQPKGEIFIEMSGKYDFRVTRAF
jgi:hypothetical protein